MGVGPRRLKRTKRVSRREILSLVRPYSPWACGMSQWLLIARSRVKPPSARGSAWRVFSSIPRTSRKEAEEREVVCSCFIPKLPLSKSALGTK